MATATGEHDGREREHQHDCQGPARQIRDSVKAMLERKGKSTIGMDHFGSEGNG